MPNLSAQSRANFIDLASGVDAELAKSKPTRELETERSRQVNYLNFCKTKLTGGEDPCGEGITWKHILACYTKNLIFGSNIKNLDLRADTVELYLRAVNKLFTQRGFVEPVNFKDPRDKSVQLVTNLRKWEKIPRRREPLTPEMIEIIITHGKKASPDSFEAAMADWTCIGIYNGQQLAEFGQRKQFEVDYHETPYGKKIMKAFTAESVKVYSKKGLIPDPTKARGQGVKFSMEWEVQKNRRNGEVYEFPYDKENPDLCAGLSIENVLARHKRLRRPKRTPLGVFRCAKTKKVKYLTGSKIGAYFKLIAKAAHPYLTDEQIKKYSAHSLRVTAATTLAEAGKTDEYIKIRLRWVGDSYRLYLRSTERLMHQHRDAMGANAKKVSELITLRTLNELLPTRVRYNAREDMSMGEYV